MQFRHQRTKRVVTATGDDAKPYQSDPKWDRIDAPPPAPADASDPAPADEPDKEG